MTGKSMLDINVVGYVCDGAVSSAVVEVHVHLAESERIGGLEKETKSRTAIERKKDIYREK
jgi:hypothetical protein